MDTMQNKPYLLAGVTLTCLLFAFSNVNATVYEVSFGNAQNNINGTPTTSGSPLDVTLNGSFLNGNHTTATARGIAGNGILRNEINQTRSNIQFGANGRPRVITRVTINDLIFYDINDPMATGTADVQIKSSYSASVNNTNFRGRFQHRISLTNAGTSQFGTTTVPGGSSISGSLTLSDNDVLLNTARTLSFYSYLELQPDGLFTSPGTGTAFSEVLFPEFILPEGIGVKSETYSFSQTVPEPSTVVLLLLGLSGLVIRSIESRSAQAFC